LKNFEEFFEELISPAHPVVVEMMAPPKVGSLYCFMLHIVVESPDHCAWLAFQSKVLFETKDSGAEGETSAVQIRKYPSQHLRVSR
jgi:hypothetical protein